MDETVDNFFDEMEATEDVIRPEVLRSLRERHKLTVYEMAKKFHIPQQTYRQWESGRRNPPEYVVRMMMMVLSHEDEYCERNRTIMNDLLRRAVLTSGCPVYVSHCIENPAVISYVNELGERKYYLSAGEVEKQDLDLLQYWLIQQCNRELYDSLQERLAECEDEKEALEVLEGYYQTQKVEVKDEYESVLKRRQEFMDMVTDTDA